MKLDLNNISGAHEALLKGKLSRTIAKIEGSLKEAIGDDDYGTDWSSGKVVKSLQDIRDTFYNELKILAMDIEKANKDSDENYLSPK